MNLKKYVEALDLSAGQVYRGNCPVCNRKNTFTAANDMGQLMWNCYSNSCTASGMTTTSLSISDLEKLLRKEYFHDDLPVDFKLPEWIVVDYTKPYLISLCEKYKLDPHWLDLRYDIREERTVFPIRQDGKLVDATGRAGHPDVAPKWRRYGVARTAYVVGDSPVAVVVEDCISAAVVDTIGGTGFALLGTSLLQEHKDLLAKYPLVVVALDPDAMMKTIAYTRELKSAGINARAFQLEDDIKYRMPDDIDRLTMIVRGITDGVSTT
jgi:hypothetical protein